MNNILSYEKYKNLVRLSESTNKDIINEGFINRFYVNKALKEEIELGKQVEERIKTTMSELNDICQTLKFQNQKGSKFKKELDKVIEDINKTSFDVLSLLGDTNVDFSGFKRSSVMANVVNLGVLLSPLKNILMLRRAYKYFIGLVKQALRRDMVMLLVNFDQFQNMILQKSIESEQSATISKEINQTAGKLEGTYQQVLAEVMGNKSGKLMDTIKKRMEIKKQQMDIMDKHNPLAQFFMNSYDNTYKTTADALKSLINDDTQKQLDANKNSIQKLGQGDDKLSVYGEMLISMAEEKSMKTVIAIHTNFLKISEVFKLSNQKKLVEMMQESEQEYQDKIAELEEERKKNDSMKFDKDVSDFIIKEGKNIVSKLSSFEDFENLKGELIGPKDTKFKKKDIVRRYLLNASHVPDYLKIIIPFDKYDAHYEDGYLSYLDVLINKVDKGLVKITKKVKKKEVEECVFSFKELKDNDGDLEIIKKFVNATIHKGKSTLKKKGKNALKLISDEIKEFDYKLLLDKILEANDNGEAEINSKAFKELTSAIDYLKRYKENDYSVPNNDTNKKSED